MTHQTIHLEGKTYVLLERTEFERLKTLAKIDDMPLVPEPDEEGNYPAVEYARVSLARKIIRDRVAARLSQRDLARLAGIRVETLCRIESGKHTPSLGSIQKIDRVLRKGRNGRKAR